MKTYLFILTMLSLIGVMAYALKKKHKSGSRVLSAMFALAIVPFLLTPQTVFAEEPTNPDSTIVDDNEDDDEQDEADLETWSMDGEAIPVIDSSKKCKLIIDYYDDLDASHPITQAVFTVYKVADMNEYGGFDSLIDGIDYGQAAGKEEEYCSETNIEVVKQQVKPVGTLITNPKGHAEIELDKGLYLVQETMPAPFHVESVPFLVQLPVVATDEATEEYVENENGDFYWVYEKRVMPKSKPTGHIMVAKVVKGTNGDVNKEFHFQIHFDAEGEFKYQTSSGKKGTIKSDDIIALKSGENIIINDLPAGCAYKVTEQEANMYGYVTTYINNEGAVTRFTTVNVEITNTMTPPPKTNDFIPIYVICGVSIIALIGLIAFRKKHED